MPQNFTLRDRLRAIAADLSALDLEPIAGKLGGDAQRSYSHAIHGIEAVAIAAHRIGLDLQPGDYVETAHYGAGAFRFWIDREERARVDVAGFGMRFVDATEISVPEPEKIERWADICEASLAQWADVPGGHRGEALAQKRADVASFRAQAARLRTENGEG